MYFFYSLVWAFSLVSSIDAGINFGDKNSTLVIEEDCHFVVAGNLNVTGTVVNNGTLTVDEDVHFDYANGTYIDHGDTQLRFTHDVTLHNDIILTPNSTLTFEHPVCVDIESAIVITVHGGGHKIKFAQSAMIQLIIGENTTVVFDNVELDGWHPGVVSFGYNASMNFVSSTITLQRDVDSLAYALELNGTEEYPSRIQGNGHQLGFFYDSGSITVPAGQYARIEDTVLAQAHTGVLDVACGGYLTLHDTTVAMRTGADFESGHLTISGQVRLTGERGGYDIFSYSSPCAIHFLPQSQLIIDACQFNYQAQVSDSYTVYGAVDEQTGVRPLIVLQNGSLFIGVNTVTLSGLTLVSQGNSALLSGVLYQDNDSNDVYGTVAFGDGQDEDTNSTLRIEDGVLDVYGVRCLIQNVETC